MLGEMPASGRVLGVDLGERRVGLALSDSARVLAMPHAILDRAETPHLDVALGQIIADLQVTLVVIGVPLSLNGASGPAARAALGAIDCLRARLGVPVETVDERLSTVEARRAREHARKGRARRHARQQFAERVDADAAAVFLQSYLDLHRGDR